MSSKEKKEKKLMNLKMIWGKKEKKSSESSQPKLPPTSNPSLSNVSYSQSSSSQASSKTNTSSMITKDLSSSSSKQSTSSKDVKPVNNNTLPTKDKDKDSLSNTNFDKVIVPANGVTYIADKIAGNGSFGVVVRATVQETGQIVAIKKVLQDKRYKNRELQIMQMLSHPNIVELKESFFTNGEKPDEVFLNLVLEYIPDNAFRVTRHFVKMQKSLPMLHIKLYTYQLLRSLAYIHSLGICHRDIKPQNLLLDPQSHVLKLCDFGSAKVLVKGEAHVAYICSRFYRAPELIFGSTNYTTAIDIWSAGCVMAEFLLGTPLFPGESGVDQLVEIIKILGTPTREQIQSMNNTYTDYKFPQIPGVSWTKVFNNKVDSSGLDLISKLLEYTPTLRISPMQALAHPFFDELRDPKTSIPNKPLPPLFNFTEAEKKEMKILGIYEKLLPRQD